jgi:hypothetical protein
MPTNTHENLRPRDLAVMLLASGDLLPRQRARDQQADLAGAELKRRVLSHVIELDPEPSELAAVLDKIVREIGEPAGPTRAIAAGVLEEFDSARTTPELLAWLLDQAAQQPAG